MITLTLNEKDFEVLCDSVAFGMQKLFPECDGCKYEKRPSSCFYEIGNCIKYHWGVSPIIRCEECEYWREGYDLFDGVPYCELTATRTEPDFFCSGGEKKRK